MSIVPQEHIYKLCSSKVRFKSEKNALNQLKKIRKSGKIVPYNAKAYKCSFCGGWHLGHKRED